MISQILRNDDEWPWVECGGFIYQSRQTGCLFLYHYHDLSKLSGSSGSEYFLAAALTLHPCKLRETGVKEWITMYQFQVLVNKQRIRRLSNNILVYPRYQQSSNSDSLSDDIIAHLPLTCYQSNHMTHRTVTKMVIPTMGPLIRKGSWKATTCAPFPPHPLPLFPTSARDSGRTWNSVIQQRTLHQKLEGHAVECILRHAMSDPQEHTALEKIKRPLQSYQFFWFYYL